MLPVSALTLTLFAATVYATFTFTTNKPTQCQNLQLEWTGGQAPFYANIYPAFGAPKGYPIPDSAFNNGNGNFSTTFPFNPSSGNIIVVMSDATGFATGGTSPIISVGKDSGSCSIDNPSPPFTWQSTSSFSQCRPFPLTIESNASFPVTVTILVPGGLHQNYTATLPGFSVPTVNIPAGTEVLLTLTDSQGRTGGDSDLTPVLQTGDDSCLKDSALTSTYVPTATATSTSTSSPSSDAGSISGATIGAIIAAVVVAIGAAAALFVFWRKHRQETSRYNRGPRAHMDLGDSPTIRPANPGYAPEPFTLAAPNPYEMEAYGHSPHSSTGFVDTASNQAIHQAPSSHAASESQYVASQRTRDRQQSISTTMSGTNRSSKAAMREQAARRYILHTDAADDSDEVEGDEVVDLPPQYSESRRPIPGLQPYVPNTSSASNPKSTDSLT